MVPLMLYRVKIPKQFGNLIIHGAVQNDQPMVHQRILAISFHRIYYTCHCKQVSRKNQGFSKYDIKVRNIIRIHTASISVSLSLVIPSIARAQYDSDGIAYDSISDSSAISAGIMTTSIAMMSTTIVVPTVEANNIKNLNGTVAKRTYKKGTTVQSILFLSIEDPFVFF